MRISATRKGGPIAQIADSGALGRAEAINGLVGVAVNFDVSPRDDGFGGNDLHRLFELAAEPRQQMRMPGDHGLHRITQTIDVKRAGEREIQLPRIQIRAARHRAGVKEQALLHRSQREYVGNLPVVPQLVDLVLAQARGHDVRGRQSAAPGAHVGADPCQRLEP